MPWDGSNRPPTASRGYDQQHRRLREWWTPYVKAGTVHCWRCHELITHDPTKRGGGWVIGHDDWDRTITRGPEHRSCNERAAHEKAKAVKLGRVNRTMVVRRPW